MIINRYLTNQEIKLLYFFLNNLSLDFQKKIISQINIANITREKTEYYHILEFENYISNLEIYKLPKGFLAEFQVIHDDGTAPTMFILHFKQGYVTEFEIYNGDYSKLNYETMCKGKVLWTD